MPLLDAIIYFIVYALAFLSSILIFGIAILISPLFMLAYGCSVAMRHYEKKYKMK